jgi:endonuclease G, mitochondrial
MKKLLFALSILPLSGLCQLHNYEMYMPSSTDNLVLHKSFYSHSHLKDKKLPEWTIYFSSNELYESYVSRNDDFRVDSTLNPEFQALKKDYYKSGYDRGHLVPAEDMNFDSTAMSESFLFTNVTPQTPTFNRGIWKKLESLTRALRMKKDSLVIITGAIFKDSTHHSTILSGGISVPEFYYKILFDVEEFTAIGFVIPNHISVEDGRIPLESYIYSVSDIEKLTGLNFFYRLPKRIQSIFENEIIYDDWILEPFLNSFNKKHEDFSKMAFVIGNSDYYRESDKLKNPKNDANLIYNTLVEMEFDTVILLQDQNHEEMENVIREFQDLSHEYDLNIFYYAGHGIQDTNGNSYLVPINYKGDSLENIAISLQELIYFLSNDEKNKSIVILDACREDYDNRSMSKPDIEDPVNLKLSFSTSFGKEAFDHPELENSLYTSTLSKNLLTPNMTLSTTFHATWNKVYNASHHKQSPTVYFGQELEKLILLPK